MDRLGFSEYGATADYIIILIEYDSLPGGNRPLWFFEYAQHLILRCLLYSAYRPFMTIADLGRDCHLILQILDCHKVQSVRNQFSDDSVSARRKERQLDLYSCCVAARLFCIRIKHTVLCICTKRAWGCKNQCLLCCVPLYRIRSLPANIPGASFVYIPDCSQHHADRSPPCIRKEIVVKCVAPSRANDVYHFYILKIACDHLSNRDTFPLGWNVIKLRT